MSPKAKKAGKSGKTAAASISAQAKKKKMAPAARKKAAKAPKAGESIEEKVAAPRITASRKKGEGATKRVASRRPSSTSGPRRSVQAALSTKELDRYRQLLLGMQRELTQAYQLSKGESRGDLDDGPEDYIDYAVHSYAKEFLLSLTEMERKRLFLVEEALERLERGEFGNCQQCGRPIHPKRLDVAPWARYCVPCQELEEMGLLPQVKTKEEEAGKGRREEEGPGAAEDDYDADAGEEADEDDEEGEPPGGLEDEGLPVDAEEH